MTEKRFEFYSDDYLVGIIDTVTGKKLNHFATIDLLNEQQATIQSLKEENEQLKIANARWLDKSLQDKQIRYSNTNHKELTKKYLQLKEENEQLRKDKAQLKERLRECGIRLDKFNCR